MFVQVTVSTARTRLRSARLTMRMAARTGSTMMPATSSLLEQFLSGWSARTSAKFSSWPTALWRVRTLIEADSPGASVALRQISGRTPLQVTPGLVSSPRMSTGTRVWSVFALSAPTTLVAVAGPRLALLPAPRRPP